MCCIKKPLYDEFLFFHLNVQPQFPFITWIPSLLGIAADAPLYIHFLLFHFPSGQALNQCVVL